MANQEHLEQIKRGRDHWNAWRDKQPRVLQRQPDLRGADLRGADLRGANLSEVILHEANLSEANLREADLRYTPLHRANLRKANLTGAYLRAAILHGADLREVNLSEANLREADLSEADLGGAILLATTFAKNDLRTTKGLTNISHSGPSDIELFSIQLPQDGSALHFLRGVGAPDEWIDYYRASMMHPIQYYSCFISYAGEDETVAKRLHADLQAEGVRCWFAPEDLKIGDRFHNRINEAIHLQDKLLLLLSEHAIASDWVEIEVRAALEKEHRQHRDVLFPVRLDESVMDTDQAWAAMLRQSRHIGDFSRWENVQVYQDAFARLLRDLKQG